MQPLHPQAAGMACAERVYNEGKGNEPEVMAMGERAPHELFSRLSAFEQMKVNEQ